MINIISLEMGIRRKMEKSHETINNEVLSRKNPKKIINVYDKLILSFLQLHKEFILGIS